MKQLKIKKQELTTKSRPVKKKTKNSDDGLSRVLISLPTEFLKVVDKFVKSQNSKRSKIIRQALVEMMDRNELIG